MLSTREQAPALSVILLLTIPSTRFPVGKARRAGVHLHLHVGALPHHVQDPAVAKQGRLIGLVPGRRSLAGHHKIRPDEVLPLRHHRDHEPDH